MPFSKDADCKKRGFPVHRGAVNAVMGEVLCSVLFLSLFAERFVYGIISRCYSIHLENVHYPHQLKYTISLAFTRSTVKTHSTKAISV